MIPVRAVIPAGGHGTRLLPATKSMPKEMLPVLEKPVIQYVVEEAMAAGLQEIVVITGRAKRAIEDHFDSSPELESFLREKGRTDLLQAVDAVSRLARLFYVRQDQPRGLGHAVLQAEPLVRGQPFAVLLGDDIITNEVPATRQLVTQFQKLGRSVFCVQKVPREDVSKYGVVATEKVAPGLHRVVDIVEKPTADEAPSDLAAIGRYVFTPGILDELKATRPGYGGEIQLTDAMRSLLRKEEVYCLEFEGTRHDVGSLKGWLDATLSLAYRDPALREHIHGTLQRLEKGGGAPDR